MNIKRIPQLYSLTIIMRGSCSNLRDDITGNTRVDLRHIGMCMHNDLPEHLWPTPNSQRRTL